jgi:hypothetical protein
LEAVLPQPPGDGESEVAAVHSALTRALNEGPIQFYRISPGLSQTLGPRSETGTYRRPVRQPLRPQIPGGQQWASFKRTPQFRHELVVRPPLLALERDPALYLSPCGIVDKSRNTAVAARRPRSRHALPPLRTSPHEVADQGLVPDQRCETPVGEPRPW